MNSRILAVSAAALVAFPAAAAAHVTVTPAEAPADSFSSFVVNVPNESETASTTTVAVKMPEGVSFVSVQPKPGWQWKAKMRTLDQPLELEGEQITEVVDSITWTGGRIGPGEFDQFGVSMHLPADEGTAIAFPAVQTYDDGTVSRWIGGEGSEEPAPAMTLTAPEAEHGATGGDDEGGQTPAPQQTVAASDDSDDTMVAVALALGAAGLLAGVAALAAWYRGRRPRVA